MASINTSSTPTNASTEHSTNENAPISFLKFSPSSVDTSFGPLFRFPISVPEINSEVKKNTDLLILPTRMIGTSIAHSLISKHHFKDKFSKLLLFTTE